MPAHASSAHVENPSLGNPDATTCQRGYASCWHAYLGRNDKRTHKFSDLMHPESGI